MIISLIDKEMVNDFTRKNGMTLVEHDEVAARWVANLIVLQQAIEDVNANKIISFHSRVLQAQEFAADNTHGISHYLQGYDVRHVNGTQNSADRRSIIEAFKASPKAILTNARCLTEGVDIPAVDMVAFVDPRQSRIDITQAVGRAMRKPRGRTTKTVGYVVVPLFAGMGNDDSLYDAIKSEKFEAVADVLNALQEHDEDLVDIIREIQEKKGKGEPFNPIRLYEKLRVIGPPVELDRLAQSIGIAIVDRLGSSWDEWFGLLLKFKAREGHCRVYQRQIEGSLTLGTWVAKQRKNFDNLLPERKERLIAIGFEWDPYAADWEKGFAALETFKKSKGHSRVPEGYVEGDYKLGIWVAIQRRSEIKNALLPERKKRLIAIGFEWDPRAADWEAGFNALKTFKAREGHCRVPGSHTEDAYILGSWVTVQRFGLDKLLPERKKRLNTIGFDWDPLAAAWEEGFATLETFKARERHCRVPRSHAEGDYKLGIWVKTQRKNLDKLNPERKKRLIAIGFDWDPLAAAWEDGFAALKTFKVREGHCRVPGSHTEDAYKLGKWVSHQRTGLDKLLPERTKRLNAIGFDWDPRVAEWEKSFAALEQFKKRERHCRVPGSHAEGDYKLGTWVSRQRRSEIKNTLLPERKKRLNAIGFEWDPLAAEWEKSFAALEQFKKREEHCRVPDSHAEGDYKLGLWVARQRVGLNKLLPERKKRLIAIGFEWDPIAAFWEEHFTALEQFKKRERHCRVPRGHAEGDLNLGSWVSKQRVGLDKLLPERKKRLNAIGFEWDAITAMWEEGFATLETFKARERHCRVPRSHAEGDYKLGIWVSTQRTGLDKLLPERKKRLNAIGFKWNVRAKRQT